MYMISLFDYSGIMAKPWADNGYECIIIDIKNDNERVGNITKVNYDLMSPLTLDIPKEEIAFISAFPPCTHLAVSGARWFKGKGLRALADSINMFATAAEYCESTEAAYMIENPVSTVSTYWRKPDYTFHPYMFTGFSKSDNYSKKTCLWVGNNFTMPNECKDTALDNINKTLIVNGNKKDRDLTPKGFAIAVFEANRVY